MSLKDEISVWSLCVGLVPEASIEHLSRISSDHCPLLSLLAVAQDQLIYGLLRGRASKLGTERQSETFFSAQMTLNWELQEKKSSDVGLRRISNFWSSLNLSSSVVHVHSPNEHKALAM